MQIGFEWPQILLYYSPSIADQICSEQFDSLEQAIVHHGKMTGYSGHWFDVSKIDSIWMAFGFYVVLAVCAVCPGNP